jgi:hypothetical protein
VPIDLTSFFIQLPAVLSKRIPRQAVSELGAVNVVESRRSCLKSLCSLGTYCRDLGIKGGAPGTVVSSVEPARFLRSNAVRSTALTTDDQAGIYCGEVDLGRSVTVGRLDWLLVQFDGDVVDLFGGEQGGHVSEQRLF